MAMEEFIGGATGMDGFFWGGYPPVSIQKTMENHHFFMGKFTINGDFPYFP